MAKRQALGRGLSALLDYGEQTEVKNEIPVVKETIGHVAGPVAMLSINQIDANPYQPRTKFSEDALLGLAKSIEAYGIIQPITVRKIGAQKYQIISGERRFRASQIVDLDEIPAYIRTADDNLMLEMALVENIQRENLDPIEVAISFKRLIEECSLTQVELSQKVGKSRSAVTNFMRLLKLPAEIQVGLIEKVISMGHARALVNAGCESVQLGIFKRIVLHGLSVRQVEDLIKEKKPETANSKGDKGTILSFEDQKDQADLRLKFGLGIHIKKQVSGAGKIEFTFRSQEEYQIMIDLLQ